MPDHHLSYFLAQDFNSLILAIDLRLSQYWYAVSFLGVRWFRCLALSPAVLQKTWYLLRYSRKRKTRNRFLGSIKRTQSCPGHPGKNLRTNCWVRRPEQRKISINQREARSDRVEGQEKLGNPQTSRQSDRRVQIGVLPHWIKNPKVHQRVWAQANKGTGDRSGQFLSKVLGEVQHLILTHHKQRNQRAEPHSKVFDISIYFQAQFHKGLVRSSHRKGVPAWLDWNRRDRDELRRWDRVLPRRAARQVSGYRLQGSRVERKE